MSGYVYLILQVDFNGFETFKIGLTKNHPNARLKQLSTGNSNKISLLNFYESENYKKIEGILHKKYLNYKTLSDNEWFNLPSEIVLGFNNECKKADELINFLKKNNHFCQ